jgi:hypothetical protein
MWARVRVGGGQWVVVTEQGSRTMSHPHNTTGNGAGPAMPSMAPSWQAHGHEDAGVRFLQAEHARALERLHSEVADLRQKNSGAVHYPLSLSSP